MPYLVNEIARLRALFDAAAQELAGLQQQRAAFVEQRTAAEARRAALQTQVDALSPVQVERDRQAVVLADLLRRAAEQEAVAAGFAAALRPRPFFDGPAAARASISAAASSSVSAWMSLSLGTVALVVPSVT